MDACHFMKKNIICLVHVDDTILASLDSEAIERENTGLGVSTDEQRHQFQLVNRHSDIDTCKTLVNSSHKTKELE